MDVRVEDRAPEVVDLEVALEPAGGREPGRIDRLHRGEVDPVGRELALDRIARAVAEALVLGVDAHEGRKGRMVAEGLAEARLDQVVEPVVERSIGAGFRPGQHHVGEGAVAWLCHERPPGARARRSGGQVVEPMRHRPGHRQGISGR